jgi:uncharacterized repeat protein (TIGR02543 family)
MKKFLFSLVFGCLMIAVLSTFTLKASNPIGSSFYFDFETKIGSNETVVSDLGNMNYGSTVTIDAGSYNTDFDFVTYIVNGKVEPNLQANHTFLVSSDLDITALYKPESTVMVAFMDSNQDMLSIQYVASGESATPPDTSSLTKPGLEVASPAWSGSYNSLTEDTVLWLLYQSTVVDTYELMVNDGSGDKGTYNYNEVATVTASGTGNFQHWEKDGMIVSLNPVYSFTVVESSTLTAVFDTELTSPDTDTLFVNAILYSGLVDDYMTVVGQFVLPETESLIEYGVIASSFQGGITLDTPDVEKIRSDKYNPNTNEFVRSLPMNSFSDKIVRGYMITTDGETETITYSDIPFFTTDLFISEYIEGSSFNEAIEIYNGTGVSVDLTDYSITTYMNGASDEGGTTYDLDLSGTIAAGDVYVVSHSSAGTAIGDKSDVISTVANYNGNDAVTLKNEGVVIDIIGEVGVDPGSEWDSMTADKTITRKSYVSSPSDVWNPNEWNVYNQDTFDHLGSHDMSFVTPLTLTISGAETVMSGSTIDLDVAYSPTASTSDVYWVSSNDSVATVDEDGVVTGESVGTVTITVFSFYDHSILDIHSVEVTAPVTYTVYYEENGGSVVADESGILSGSLATEPTPPTKADHKFNGWYVDSFFDVVFDFDNDVITEDTTLYAEWLEEFDVTFDPYDESSWTIINSSEGAGEDQIWTFNDDNITLNSNMRSGFGDMALAFANTNVSAGEYSVEANFLITDQGSTGEIWVGFVPWFVDFDNFIFTSLKFIKDGDNWVFQEYVVHGKFAGADMQVWEGSWVSHAFLDNWFDGTMLNQVTSIDQAEGHTLKVNMVKNEFGDTMMELYYNGALINSYILNGYSTVTVPQVGIMAFNTTAIITDIAITDLTE